MPRPRYRVFVNPCVLIKITGLLACIIGIYSMVGFVLVPRLLQSRLPAMAADQTGLHIETGALHINPFTFTARAEKLRILDKHQQPLFDMDALQVNVAGTRSLLHPELHIQEILLSHPNLRLHRAKNGAFEALSGLSSSKDQAPGLPFVIDKVAIENATLEFDDASLQPAFQTQWRVHNAEILNLSSQPDTHAEFILSASGKTEHERLDIKGQLGLTPLKMESELTLQNLDAEEAARYFTAENPYQIKTAVLSGLIHYTLEQDKHIIKIVNASLRELFVERQNPAAYLKSKEITLDNLEFNSHGAEIDLPGLVIRELSMGTASGGQNNKDPAIDFSVIEAHGIKLNPDALSLKMERVTSNGANISLQFNKGGQLSIPGAPWQQQQNQATTLSSSAKDAWQVDIASLELEQYHATLQDFSIPSRPAYQLPPLHLQLDAFNTRPGAQMQIRLSTDSSASTTGKANIDGKLSFNPLLIADLHLSLLGVPLPPLQPYLDQYAKIDLASGLLALEGDIDYYQDKGKGRDSIRFAGEGGVSQLLTRDRRHEKDFIAWKALNVQEIVFENLPDKRLSIGEITAVEPYARVVIAHDGRINLKDNLTSATPAPAPAQQASVGTATSSPAKPPLITIGGLRIREGQIDFSDFTLKPTSFSAEIKALNGTIRSLSSEENTHSDLMLEGRINADEPVKIFGQINPLSMKTYTKLELQFLDINLAAFSPYAGKFAGYRIEEGKLSMDLKYQLIDDQLEASNRFQIDHLILGEKVESAEATELPLKLVISLLKDANGRIEFELPVSGDLKQPDVSIGGILADASMKMFSKLVTAPFSAMGGLLAIGDEKEAFASCIPFLIGQSKLSNTETQKLVLVSDMLKNRPELHLDIRGNADPALDRHGLAEGALMRQLKNTLGIEERLSNRQASAADSNDLNPEEYKKLFIPFYLAKYPDDPIAMALRSAPDSEDEFNRARKKVLEGWRVTEADFQRLAQNRAQHVRNVLVGQNGVAENRIYLQDNTITQGSNTPPGACLSLDSQ